jgi:hypothetical protein
LLAVTLRRACAGLAFAACLGPPVVARAEARGPIPPIDLEWVAPAECPGRDAVLGEIGRVLGPSPGPRGPASARVVVSREGPERWHAVLRVDARNAQTERAFDAESCATVVSATALIVAVAIDGRLPESAMPPSTPPGVLPAPPWPSHRSAASEVDVGVGAVLDVRTLPTVAPGAELAVGWAMRVGEWRVRALASGQIYPPSPEFQYDRQGSGGYFGFLVASGVVCTSPVIGGRFDVGPCLGAQGNYMWAWSQRGSAGFQGQPNGAWWVDLSASLLGSFAVSSHVAFFARADGLFPVDSPPRFAVAVKGSSGPGNYVYEAPRGPNLRAALGLELRFF